MKRVIIIKAALLSAIIACQACNENNGSPPRDTVVASIDEECIYSDELDAIIGRKLQEHSTSEIQENALKQLIDTKLIRKEAKKSKMNDQQFIDYYTTNKINTLGIDSLLRRHNISTIFQQSGMDMFTASASPTTAHVPRLQQLKEMIINELLISLRENKMIQIYSYYPQNATTLAKGL